MAYERLAVHLSMASLILIALVWTAPSIAPLRPAGTPPRRIVLGAAAILVLLVVQIALGGLVAGLKAGLVYDTWPLIDGRLIPPADGFFFLRPVWTNFTDNHLTVQFVHCMLAYVLVALALLHAADCARASAGDHRAGAAALVVVLLLQACLGVATLLCHVPMLLALAHQLVAMLALILATAQARSLLAAREAADVVVSPDRGTCRRADARRGPGRSRLLPDTVQRTSALSFGNTLPRHWLAPKACSTAASSATTTHNGTAAPRRMRSRWWRRSSGQYSSLRTSRTLGDFTSR